MAISQSLPTTDPAFHLNFQGARRLDPRMSFTRSSIATYIDEDGLIKTAGVNQARFTYDPATGESLGLLIEEQRTNLHLYSQEINLWAAESGGSVVANNQISPDGTQNADTLTGTQYGSSVYVVTNLNNATTYTFSVFLKYISGNSLIEIQIGDAPFARSITRVDTQNGTLSYNSGGAIVSYSIEQYANGWYRYSITRTTTASGGGFMDINHVSSTTSEVAIWGAQLEAGAFPTSYIPTSGSAVTRSEDIASFTSQGISSGGTLLSLGGGSPSSPASYNSSEVVTSPVLSNPVIVLNSQLSDSSTIPTLLYYPEPISGDAIKAMRAYAPIVKNGLVLHLDAGVDKSYPNAGTIWRDLSGNGNNGTLVNGPTYDSGNGGSLVFDGVDDYVSLPYTSLLNLGTEFTICAFSKDINLSSIGSIFSSLDVTTTDIYTEGFHFYRNSNSAYGMDANTMRFQYGKNSWGWNVYSSNGIEINDNGWHHVCITASSLDTSSPTIIFYIDGSSVIGTLWTSSFIAPIRYANNVNSIRIGSVYTATRPSYSELYSNITTSHIQIYNRALSSTEILQNFNASRSRFNI